LLKAKTNIKIIHVFNEFSPNIKKPQILDESRSRGINCSVLQSETSYAAKASLHIVCLQQGIAKTHVFNRFEDLMFTLNTPMKPTVKNSIKTTLDALRIVVKKYFEILYDFVK
jgi:hypothetical protein